MLERVFRLKMVRPEFTAYAIASKSSNGSALVTVLVATSIVGIVAGTVMTFSRQATEEAQRVRRATISEAVRDYVEGSIDCAQTARASAGCSAGSSVPILNSDGGIVVGPHGRELGPGEVRAVCTGTANQYRIEVRWRSGQGWTPLYGDEGLECI